MRILITGAGGGVGRALADRLAAQYDILACDHARLDITDRAQVQAAVSAFRPDALVNPAAITNVDLCERDPELAFRVNALAPGILAEAAEAAGALFIHLSTDYVFGSQARTTPYTEPEATCPINTYGQAKRDGELAALRGCPRTYIARTAWVMNPARPGFLAAMLAAAPTGQVQVAQQTSSPTGLTDLVTALTHLLTDRPPVGIYHLVNAGQCSRRAMAEMIFHHLRAEVTIAEVPVSHFPGAAPRPDFSALASPAWHAAGLPPFRPWQEALAEVIDNLTGTLSR